MISRALSPLKISNRLFKTRRKLCCALSCKSNSLNYSVVRRATGVLCTLSALPQPENYVVDRDYDECCTRACEHDADRVL
jgi:hypothetical protein